uniref:Uncharacterized protein n=1 Tax=Tanacetum cinerariifolium TaxID=118510 RepID=A0A699HY99_TANCI|nr:hypothetical protein [Tanacetum cinerariifolium]
MDAPLSPNHAFDFFIDEPVSGLAEVPNNQNRWIKWDVPLRGEIDEPMENPGFDDEEELDEFMDNEDVWTRMSNLEYRHEELVKKMVKVSDAEAVQVVSRLEEIETIVQQVESRVDTYLSGQMAVPGQDVIIGLNQHEQTLQTALHGAELQNQQLRTRVAEMGSRDGILMSYMLWMEEHLTVLEKRPPGPPSGTQ